MTHLRSIILLSILCGLAVSLRAEGFDSSHRSLIFDEKRKQLTITTNDVVLIKAQNGAVAVVRFTSFGAFTNSGPLTASYLWRCRPALSQAETKGTGKVRESYDRKPRADGKGNDVIPRADHDTLVRAGDVQIEWSYGSESCGYLYYYASRANIQVLSSDAFQKDL